MSRTVRDASLETRAARLRLAARPKPHWRVVESGLHFGYRRLARGGGSWVARRFLGAGRYAVVKIGAADDLADADGVAVLNYQQAQSAARAWWQGEQRRAKGVAADAEPYTVERALADYFAERARRGSKGLAKDQASATARIVPTLGAVEVAKLTTKRIREWHAALATAPRFPRAARFAKLKEPTAFDASDPDKVRARKATANRTLTILRAALNCAFHDGHAEADEVWRKAKAFRATGAAIVRFLDADECRRLVNACDGAFRDLVRGALLTGCRYGELARLRVGDFNAAAGTVTIRESKAGKPRHVALTDEGTALLTTLTAGRAARDLIFPREDGEAWGPSQQQRPVEAASLHARIDPPATFHILRHSYASALAMRGAPMGVIAAQLGHADTRQTEKHYAHLAPNYVAATVRASLPALGIVEVGNVVTPLRTAEAARGAR